MIKLCPLCKGKLWSEPVKIRGDGGSYYSDNFKKDGIDVCCDKGHRFQLTAKHYQDYLKQKTVLKIMNKGEIKMKDLNWKYIDDYHKRCRVPFLGWLVKAYEDIHEVIYKGGELQRGMNYRISICFVPDPTGKWEL